MVDTLRIKRRAAGGAAGPPASLAAAEIAYNEQDDTLYYGKGNSGGNATSIVAIGGPGAFAALGSASVSVGTSPPASPSAGNLWWDTNSGNLFIWYNDGTSSQWVVVVNAGASKPGLVFLASYNATNAASLVIPLSGSFRRYKVLLDGVQNITASTVVLVQASSDGGATWKTTGWQWFQNTGISSSAANTPLANNADAGLRPWGNLDLSPAAAISQGCELTIHTPPGAGSVANWNATIFAASVAVTTQGGGRCDATVWNAIRVIAAAGNVTVAGASVYGMNS